MKPLREHFITRHTMNPQTVETEINGFSSLTGRSGTSAKPPPEQRKAKADVLDEAEACAV